MIKVKSSETLIKEIDDNIKELDFFSNNNQKQKFMETLKVKIKKLVPEASIPTYATPGSACVDLKATSYYYDEKLKCHVYGTGLAMEIPKGYVGNLYVRSSNRKTDVYLTNGVGKIDSDYRGEVMVSFKDRDAIPDGVIPYMIKPYEVGNKIAQIEFVPIPKIEFEVVEELSKTERGEKGHGSSGD